MSFIDFVRFNWNADPLAPGRNMRNIDQMRMRRRELRREHNNNRRVVQQGNNLRAARIPIRRIARHIPPNRRDELVRFNELRLKRANDQNAAANNNNNNNNLIVNNNSGLNHYYFYLII